MSPEATHRPNSKELYRSRISAAEKLGVIADHAPRHVFLKTLLSHFDDLPIDWDRYHDHELLHTTVPRIASAFSLAYHSQHETFPSDNVYASESSTWNALRHVFDDPNSSAVFTENLAKLPVSFMPKRAKVAGMVLNHEFGNRPISVVDLGSGSGYMLPMIAQPDLMQDTSFANPDANIIAARGSNANITVGVNVDILDKDEVTKRTYANAHERKREQLDHVLHGVTDEQFPFVQADMTDTETCAARVKAKLKERTGKPYADTLITSFSLYQIKNRVSLFSELQEMFGVLLDEGGIWINFGFEVGYDDTFVEHSVDVNAYCNAQMNYKGTPFTIDDQGEITDIEMSYFDTPSTKFSRRD